MGKAARATRAVSTGIAPIGSGRRLIAHLRANTPDHLIRRQYLLHVHAPSIDGVTGASPIHLGREAIGLAITLESHAALLFGNGARPGGIISVPGDLGDTGAPKLARSWQMAFGGGGAGKTAVLEGGATFNQVALTSVDAEFMAQRQHQVREIANLFGVPAIMLGDLSSATFSNAEALGQAFRDEAILPLVMSWEAALERCLLEEDELPAYRIAIDTDALDRADLAAKSDALAKRRAAGVVTANEERRALNLPSHPQGNELGSPYTTPGTAKPEAKPAAEEGADA
ncbi:MAG: phage portal protein [Methylorubrum populi]